MGLYIVTDSIVTSGNHSMTAKKHTNYLPIWQKRTEVPWTCAMASLR